MTTAPVSTPLSAFVPWRDDVLLPDESVYAAWSKIAWFVAIPPAKLVRLCRATDKPWTPLAPARIRYGAPREWTGYLEKDALLPRLGGRPVRDALEDLDLLSQREVTKPWRSEVLRVCDECIHFGIHLRIHQHLAVARCPIHNTPMRSRCRSCDAVLGYEVRYAVPAFACEQCGGSLLNGGDPRPRPENWLGARAEAQIEDAKEWLMSLDTEFSYACGIGRLQLPHDHQLRVASGASVYAGAALNAALNPPRWAQSYDVAGVKVGLRHFQLSGSEMAHTPPLSQGGISDSPGSDVHGMGWHEVGFVNRQRALRRVTSAFLRAHRRHHTECLDIPLHIFGGADVLKDPHRHELFDCCPVAVGFWIWRMLSERSLGLSLPRSHERQIDRLLYCLERSRLHFMILVAQLCSTNALGGHHDESLEVIEALFRDCREPWSAVNHRPRLYGSRDKYLTYVHLDATALIEKAVCSGAAPYIRSLKRRLRDMVSVRPPYYIDLESEWERHQLKPGEPFTEMKGDWVFLRTSPDPRHNSGHPGLRAILGWKPIHGHSLEESQLGPLLVS